MLQREGWDINIKRADGIYNEMGLLLRNKTPKRRVKARLRAHRAPATGPNDVWGMDFVPGQLATRKTIRVLTLVETFLRFSPVIDPRFSYRVEDVVATPKRVCAGRAIRRRSGLTRAASLSAVTSTCGHTRRASPKDALGKARR